MIPEPRYAKVVEVAADSVITAGEDLAVRVSLRVGRRTDRQIEMALSLPEDLPAGAYRLEVGSKTLLGESDSGGGDFGGDLGWLFTDLDGGDETLGEVFARLNRPDENVLLKAQLTVGDPFGVDSPPAPVTSQQEVDLYLAGTASLEVEVVEP